MLSGGNNIFRTSLINFLFFDGGWQILPVVTLMWRNGYSTILRFNNFVEIFLSDNGLDVREIPTQKKMLNTSKDCLFGFYLVHIHVYCNEWTQLFSKYISYRISKALMNSFWNYFLIQMEYLGIYFILVFIMIKPVYPTPFVFQWNGGRLCDFY